MSERKLIQNISANALIAAVYFVLTVSLGAISFLNIQIRIAEALVLLCFFRKDYVFGLTLGCLLANLFSPLGMVDVLFGTTATLISCLLIAFSKHLTISVLFPVVANAFIVGAELYYVLALPFWLSVLEVGIGELLSVLIGYALFMIMGKNKRFLKVVRAEQNLEFKW